MVHNTHGPGFPSQVLSPPQRRHLHKPDNCINIQFIINVFADVIANTNGNLVPLKPCCQLHSNYLLIYFDDAKQNTNIVNNNNTHNSNNNADESI